MKKLITFLILSSLSLTACISDPGPIEPPTEEGENMQVPAETTESDALLDDGLFARATMNSDSATCKEILNTDLKNECLEVVHARIQTQTALTEVSLDPCQSINLDRYKEDCENQVQAILDQLEEQNEYDEAQLSVEAIEAALDLDACYEVELENLKLQCLLNVSTGLAAQNKDSAYCDPIKEYEQQYDACLAVAINSGGEAPLEADILN